MPRITTEEINEFHDILNLSIKKLESDKNSKKKHWSTLSLDVLQKMIMVECFELDLAMLSRNVDEINSELDDIINLAVFMKHNIKNGRC